MEWLRSFEQGKFQDVSAASQFVASIKTSASPALEEILNAGVQRALPVAAGATELIASTLAGILLKAVVKALSQPDDDLVAKQIEFLRAAPYRRAASQLREAMDLDPANADEVRFRQIRLENALGSLDEAESLATSPELLGVTFMKANAQALIAGGSKAALKSCARFHDLVMPLLDRMQSEITNNDSRLNVHLSRLEKMTSVKPAKGGGGLVGWGSTVDPLQRRSVEMKAAARRKYGEQLRDAKEELGWARDVIEALRCGLELPSDAQRQT